MKLLDLKDKSILILGFGQEGQDTFLFLRKKFPNKVLGISDSNDDIKIKQNDKKFAKLFLGKNYMKAIDKYDIVIKSPGVPIHLSEIEKAYKQGKITSQTEIFFAECPGMIIGITGTKGKSTTASLIYEILKAGNLKTHLVGNIGKPVLSSLLNAKPEDIYVFELSCHQLYNTKIAPDVAVLLNIYEEHLDYYKDYKEYIRTKSNITKYQHKYDYLVYNSKNALVSSIAKKSKAKKNPFIGKYYTEDIEAAKRVAKILNIPQKIVLTAIKNFKPLPHRLEKIGEYKGIIFYNDSIATIPGATIGALNYLGNNVQTLILGGMDRGINYKKLAQEINKRKSISNLIFIGKAGDRIYSEITKSNSNINKNYFFAKNMKDIVNSAYENTQKGKICLLSPSAPSYDLFKNFEDRGNQFKKQIIKNGKD